MVMPVPALAHDAPDGGDRPAFEEVYDEHFAFVWRSARRLGVSEAALDDAVQDVFVVVHRKLPDFEGRSTLRTWLFSITRRVARDFRRRAERKDRGKVPAEGLVAAGDGPRAEAERNQAREVLQSILAELGEDKREVFVLAELEQMTAPEIAEATDSNVNTVYSRLRAARRLFEAAVVRHHAGGIDD